jgi:succinate dehydrogenase/fumarate reductase cytochrome b subunit
VCGPVVSAALIVAMLFEGWPSNRLSAGWARALTLGLTALVALALNRALAAYANGVHWAKATPDDWITVAALAFIGAGIILHVGIGLRWPFAAKANAGAKAR